eukprot:gene5669-141_t
MQGTTGITDLGCGLQESEVARSANPRAALVEITNVTPGSRKQKKQKQPLEMHPSKKAKQDDSAPHLAPQAQVHEDRDESEADYAESQSDGHDGDGAVTVPNGAKKKKAHPPQAKPPSLIQSLNRRNRHVPEQAGGQEEIEWGFAEQALPSCCHFVLRKSAAANKENTQSSGAGSLDWKVGALSEEPSVMAQACPNCCKVLNVSDFTTLPHSLETEVPGFILPKN